jgi:hypothetical protein
VYARWHTRPVRNRFVRGFPHADADSAEGRDAEHEQVSTGGRQAVMALTSV